MEFLTNCNRSLISPSTKNYEELTPKDKMEVIEMTLNDKLSAGYKFKKKDIVDLLKDKACIINKMDII